MRLQSVQSLSAVDPKYTNIITGVFIYTRPISSEQIGCETQKKKPSTQLKIMRDRKKNGKEQPIPVRLTFLCQCIALCESIRHIESIWFMLFFFPFFCIYTLNAVVIYIEILSRFFFVRLTQFYFNFHRSIAQKTEKHWNQGFATWLLYSICTVM